MDYAALYVIVSMPVGLLQVFDNLLLVRANGRVTSPNILISVIELGWIIVSCLALFKFETVPKFLPLSFVVFAVGGSVYTAIRFRDLRPEAGEIIPKDFAIPTWLAVVGAAFGVYFSLASYLVSQSRF